MTIYWFRRDLRIANNAGLDAVTPNELILPIFCLEEQLFSGKYSSHNRNQFLLKSLIELEQEMQMLGSKLLVIEGEAVSTITKLFKNNQINSVYFNKDYSKFSTKRDQELYKAIIGESTDTTQIKSFKDSVIFEYNEIVKTDGSAYSIFTPYKNAWLKKLISEGYNTSMNNGLMKKKKFCPINLINQLNLADLKIINLNELWQNIPKNQSIAQEGGRSEGLDRLKKFITREEGSGGIKNYHINRDRIDITGTSNISAHLKFGTISIREVIDLIFREFPVKPIIELPTGIQVWLNELIWREFYMAVLANNPDVEIGAFRKQYNNIQWENNPKYFEAWQTGRTGYPIIDACMRQLLITGWMHNRGRMLVAMFLTKDLLCDWRWGEKYFMRHLVDGDKAANNGGWQWSAGTGTDAAPYFRIFNPVTQAKKIDPKGDFVRKWIPELSQVSDSFIHAPWLNPNNKYIPRIVVHEEQRLKALAMYKNIS